MNESNAFPEVKKLFAVPCEAIQPNAMMAFLATGLAAVMPHSAKEIEFFGRAYITVEAADDGLTQTAKLSFKSKSEIDCSTPLAFVTLLNCGRCLLIGAKEPCFPAVSFKFFSGDRAGDPAAYEYSVVYTAECPAIDAII